MSRGRVFGAAVLLLVVLSAFVFWRIHDDEPVARAPRTPSQTEVPLPEPPPPPAQEREMSPAGLVVGADLAPVGGLEIRCGEEKAVVGQDGTFAFPPAARTRSQPLAVLRGAEEISRWEAVLTGDLGSAAAPPAGAPTDGEPAPGAELEGDAVIPGLTPERPARIRWTINLAPAVEFSGGAWIGIGDSLVEEWGNGVRVRVKGQTRLPDDAHVQTSLYFDEERTIAAPEDALVKGGHFEAAMASPGEQPFYAGIFEVHASFSLVLEPFSSVEAWRVSRPEIDWDSLRVPEATRKIRAGSPGDSRDQDTEARNYYSRMLDEARKLDRSLKTTLSSRVDERRIFLEGKKPRQRTDPEAQPWFRRDYLTPEGKLDEPRWRKFMDEEWRPAVQRLMEEHSRRGQEKYMRANALLTNLLDAILDESRGFSMFVVYPAFGLAAHPNDFYVDEERAGDLVRLEKVVATGFEGLERFRHLGE